MKVYDPAKHLGEMETQQKLFAATGLKVGDTLRDSITGEKGTLCISGIGYACIKLTSGRKVIWGNNFVKV